MKVLFVTPWYPNPENPTLGNFIIRQAELVAREHEVYLLAFSGLSQTNHPISVERTEAIRGWHFLYSGNKVSRLKNYRKCRKMALEKMISEGFQPDIIHGQITHHIGDVLYSFKRHFKVPVVCSEHWSGHLAERSVQLKVIDRIRLSLAKTSIDVILPVTQQLGEAFRLNGFKGEIEIWRNLVDEEMFFPQVEKHFDFIHISTLDENKRPEDIIRAFSSVLKSFPNAKMSLGGDGDTSPLKQLKDSLDITDHNLDIHGKLAYEEVAKRMRESRVLIQFSNYENLPCTIGEALMSGLRVISSNVGGISELVNSSNGALVPKGYVDQLTEAMMLEMKGSPTNTSFNELSTSRLLKQINSIYNRLQ